MTMKTLLAAILALVPSALLSQDQIDMSIETPTISFALSDGQAFGGTFVLSRVEWPTDPISMLQAPKVLGELELVDEQRTNLAAQIEKLSKTFHQKERQLAQKSNGSNQAGEQLTQLRRNFDADVKAASEDILLPFQLERLKQIRLQAELRNGGSRAVESDAFADLLQLTEEQKEELRKKAAAAEVKLEREIKALRQKRHREVLEEVLTKKQLQLLDENLGRPIADSGR